MNCNAFDESLPRLRYESRPSGQPVNFHDLQFMALGRTVCNHQSGRKRFGPSESWAGRANNVA